MLFQFPPYTWERKQKEKERPRMAKIRVLSVSAWQHWRCPKCHKPDKLFGPRTRSLCPGAGLLCFWCGELFVVNADREIRDATPAEAFQLRMEFEDQIVSWEKTRISMHGR